MNSRKFTTNFESTQRSSLSFTSKNSSLSNFRVFLSKNFLFNREHRFEFPDCSTEKNVENRSPSHRSIEEKRSGRRESFGELNFETGHRPSRRRMRMRKLFGQSTMVFASLLLVAHVSHLVMFNLSRDPTTGWRMIRRFVAIVGHDKRAISFDQRMVTLRGGGRRRRVWELELERSCEEFPRCDRVTRFRGTWRRWILRKKLCNIVLEIIARFVEKNCDRWKEEDSFEAYS